RTAQSSLRGPLSRQSDVLAKPGGVFRPSDETGISQDRPRRRDHARDACNACGRSGPSAYTRAVTGAGEQRRVTVPLDESVLFVFMLAAFLGFELVRRVSPLLHTPLMSLTNAISAIAVVGAILIAGAEQASTLSRVLGFVAVTASTINVVS